MKELLIGEVIRQRRIALGITQEELCEGICAPVTLSRLENGTQTPSRNRINALLQRLGLPGDRYYAIISKQEKELERLQTEANVCCASAETTSGSERIKALEEAWAALAQLEQVVEPDDRQMQQFILQSRAMLGFLEGRYDNKAERAMLLDALRLTVPCFDPENINSCLYSLDEIKILNQIAITYMRDKQDDIALLIYRQLLYYVKKHCPNMLQSNRLLPVVAHNYALALMHCKNYREALKIAEKGKHSCIEYGCCQALPGLTHIMMECCHMLGDDERSVKLCYEAYYLYESFESKKGIELLAVDAKKYLDITLSPY